MGLAHTGVKGSIPIHTAHLVGALRERGVEIETFGWGRHGDDDSAARRIGSRLSDAWRVRRRHAGRQFDVLFVMTAHNLTGVARDLPLSVLMRRQVPMRVLQFHGSECDKLVEPGHHVLKVLTRLLIKNWDLLLVLSEEERRQWRQFAPRADVRVVRNPYVRTMSGLAPGEPVTATQPAAKDRKETVLFVGRLLAEKGVFDLVEAFRLARQQVDCALLLVGDGPERQALGEMVERQGLTAATSMPGYLVGDDLRGAYREASVFVLPSYREGFPTVISEAMDAGLPIITTRIRGAADILAQDVNALFVPPGRPNLLAESLVRLLRDEALRVSMGAANAEKVAEFEPAEVAGQLLGLLESH
jgi:glycosyltransferase involved in cell wall biosynthesis